MRNVVSNLRFRDLRTRSPFLIFPGPSLEPHRDSMVVLLGPYNNVDAKNQSRKVVDEVGIEMGPSLKLVYPWSRRHSKGKFRDFERF